MPPARWLGFAMIWVALAVFSADARACQEGSSGGFVSADVDQRVTDL